MILTVQHQYMAVCRLDPQAAVPLWAMQGSFWSLTRTAEELSIVCRQENVPNEIQAEGDWRALKVEGPLDFALIGILAELAGILARAEVSLFALSTFDTDYLLVRADRLEAAVAALRSACHEVRIA